MQSNCMSEDMPPQQQQQQNLCDNEQNTMQPSEQSICLPCGTICCTNSEIIWPPCGAPISGDQSCPSCQLCCGPCCPPPPPPPPGESSCMMQPCMCQPKINENIQSRPQMSNENFQHPPSNSCCLNCGPCCSPSPPSGFCCFECMKQQQPPPCRCGTLGWGCLDQPKNEDGDEENQDNDKLNNQHSPFGSVPHSKKEQCEEQGNAPPRDCELSFDRPLCRQPCEDTYNSNVM